MSDQFEQKPPIDFERERPKGLELGKVPEKFDVSGQSVNIPREVLTTVKERRDLVGGIQMLISEVSTEKEVEWSKKAPYNVSLYSSYPGNLYLSFTQISDPDHPHAKLQIARVEFDVASGQVASVTRNVSPSLFKVAMADFPVSTLFGQIREVLKLPAPTDRDRAEYTNLIEDARQIELTKDELLKLSNQNIYSGRLVEDQNNTERIHNVSQGEYSAVKNGSTRYLATFGASDCLIVSIYDPLQQKGALAHIDGLTDEALTTQIMAREVDRNKTSSGDEPSRQTYKVTILGGTLASTRQLINLYRVIQGLQSKNRDIKIVVGQVLTGTSQSLALDLSSGEISAFIPNQSFHPEWSLTSSSTRSRMMEANARGKQSARLSLPKENKL